MRNPIGGLFSLLMFGLVSNAWGSPIAVRLQFDSDPMVSTVLAKVSCRNEKTRSRFDCSPRFDTEKKAYLVEGMEPGRYLIEVDVNENSSNPGRYPGDYQGILKFNVTETGPAEVTIGLSELLHLTAPGDNGSAIGGALGPCEDMPRFEAEYASLDDDISVPFAWEALPAENVEFHYALFHVRCEPFKILKRRFYRQTADTRIDVRLPPNAPGEFYLFRVTGEKEGRRVGEFYVHDGTSHTRNYRFVVAGPKVPAQAYYLVLVALLALLLLLRLLPGGVMGRVRKFGQGILVLAIAGFGLWIGFLALRPVPLAQPIVREVAVVPEDEAARSEKIAAIRRDLENAVTPIDWWENVEVHDHPIESYGDVISEWLNLDYVNASLEKKRRFFKTAYEATWRNPADAHLAVEAIRFTVNQAEDRDFLIALAEVALRHYFDYEKPKRLCPSCTSAYGISGITISLARAYHYRGRNRESIAVIERLIEKRGEDVGRNDMATLLSLKATAYWDSGQHQKAVELMEALVRGFGDTRNAEYFAGKLVRYRQQLSQPEPAQTTTP